MLNYSCKKVLDCLIKIHNQKIDFSGKETLSKYLPNWIMKNIEPIMTYLESNEYLNYSTADDDYYDFELTYKGLAYKSFDFENLKDVIFKSVLIPIVVTLLTLLITRQILTCP